MRFCAATKSSTGQFAHCRCFRRGPLISKDLLSGKNWPYPRLGHSGSIALESTESVIYEAQPVGSSGFHQLHRASAQTAGDRGRENLEIAGWPLKHGAVCGALNSRLRHLGDALVAQVGEAKTQECLRHPLESKASWANSSSGDVGVLVLGTCAGASW